MPYRDPDRQKEAQRQHYLSKKAEYRSRNETRRTLRRLWFLRLKESLTCQRCPENHSPCLDFHHPGEKDDGVSILLFSFRSMKRVIEEIERCVPLCANCHRKVHSGFLEDKFEEYELTKVPQNIRFINEKYLRNWSSCHDLNVGHQASEAQLRPDCQLD